MKWLQLGTGKVRAVALSPDGRTLAAGFGAGAVHVCDWVDGRVRHILPEPQPGGTGVRALAFSPDGGILAVAWNRGTTAVYRLDRGEPVWSDRPLPDPKALTFGGGRLFLVQPAYAYRARSSVVLVEALGNRRAAVLRGVEPPMWSSPLSVAGGRLWLWYLGHLHAYPLDDLDRPTPAGPSPQAAPSFWSRAATRLGVLAAEPAPPPPVVIEPALLVPWDFPGRTWAASPDGSLVLQGGTSGAVRCREVATGALRAEWSWPIRHAYSVAVAPDGLLAAAGGGEGRVVVWDLDP